MSWPLVLGFFAPLGVFGVGLLFWAWSLLIDLGRAVDRKLTNIFDFMDAAGDYVRTTGNTGRIWMICLLYVLGVVLPLVSLLVIVQRLDLPR